MRAGALRHTIQIQSDNGTTRNSYGERVDNWESVDTVFAEVVTLSGRELIRAQQVASTTTHQIRMRHYDGLTKKHRIKFGDKIFDINAINNVEGRNIEDVLDVKEAG